MAITAVARSTYNSSVSFNWRDRTWEAVFEYHVQGDATIEEVAAFFDDDAGATFLPRTITIEGTFCYAAARRVDQLTTAGYWPVSQIYRGRATSAEPWKRGNETQISYITQLQDLDDQGIGTGVYPAIGADSEGTPRQVPILLYRVDWILSITDAFAYMGFAEQLVGVVNEAAWDSPMVGSVPEGWYLLAGARIEEQQETMTAIYSLFFSHDPSKPGQHRYSWREYDEVDIPNTKNRVKRIYGATQTASIYEIAGTGVLPDFEQMIPFAPL